MASAKTSFSSASPLPPDIEFTYERPSRRQDFQIAIICALPLEYDAAILLVDEFWDQDGRQYGRTSGDTNVYRNGRIGTHNVVLMLLPNMGKATVAGSAASLRTSYQNLKLVLLVGVCGGVPTLGSHEALLGDTISGEFIPKEATETSLGAPNKDIRSLLAYFKTNAGRDDLRRNTANNLMALQRAALAKSYHHDKYHYPGLSEDKLFAAAYRHKHRERVCDFCHDESDRFCDEAAQTSCADLGCDEDRLIPRQRLFMKRDLKQEQAQSPDIFVGRIASADTVMKSGEHRDQIAERYGVIAFEMEGAGLWDEAPCIVVKGICDYADSHKNKIWQPFAAATAAAAAKAMLGQYDLADNPRPLVISTDSSREDCETPAHFKEIIPSKPEKSSYVSALVHLNGSPALRDAISDFQNSLTNNQRQELQDTIAIPDVDAVLIFTAQLDSLNRNRQGRSIASRLHSVLQSVRDFSTVVETFISMHKGIGPLLWGTVKLTMLAAVKSNLYYEALCKLFMDLRNYFPHWTEYQILCPSSTQLQKALCNFYTSLVRCCKHTVEITQRTWSTYFFTSLQESFEQEFKRDVDDIKRCSTDVKEALYAAKAQADHQNQQLQSEKREEASKEKRLRNLFSRKQDKSSKMKAWQLQSDERRAKERRQQLLDSLSKYDYLTPLKQSRRKRLSGTSEWLFQTREFSQWIHNTESPLLWCYGKIGSGKTILTASVIDKLLTEKRHPDVFISFFFVRFDDRNSLTAEAILRSIIQQVLNHKGISEEIESFLENLQFASSSLEEILELLLKVTISFNTHYILIDGVDECEKQDRNDLLQALSRLVSGGFNTKIFLASRDSVAREIEKEFPTHGRVSMNCSTAQSDIATYVERMVQDKLEREELIVGDVNLIEEIKLALTEGADGMFLWVAFQIDELGLQHCDDDIRKAILNLPKNLEETFDRAVGRIVSRGEKSTATAQQVFRWVAASKEPLSLDQLREVIFIEIGQQYSMPERHSNGIYNISSWCENLVYIDEELQTVQFAHQSVRQFFLEKASKARHNQFHLKLDDADHHIGEICVTYLNFNDFKTTLARRQRPMPSMPPTAIASTALRPQWKAAVSSIPTLWKSSLDSRVGSATASAVEALASFQRTDTRETKERLQVAYPFLKYASTHCILHTTGFQKDKSKTWTLWERMMVQGHDLMEKVWGEATFNEQSSFILDWSIKNRHYALIRLTFLMGKISIEDRGHMLINAAIEGDVMMLDIVLKGEIPESEIDKACIEAIAGGRLEIVERFLATDANISGVYTQNTLRVAARRGRLDIILKLLAGWGHINAAPDIVYDQTVLQAAAECGRLEVIERLLAAGADVSVPAINEHYRTPLQVAAECGRLDIVEVLLAAGADVDASPKASYGRTALQAAAEFGHMDIIEKLLAAGANVNSIPAWQYGRTALQAAAKNGRMDIVERLLAAGAEADEPRGQHGQTALQAAVVYGHLDIESRLIQAGART